MNSIPPNTVEEGKKAEEGDTIEVLENVEIVEEVEEVEGSEEVEKAEEAAARTVEEEIARLLAEDERKVRDDARKGDPEALREMAKLKQEREAAADKTATATPLQPPAEQSREAMEEQIRRLQQQAPGARLPVVLRDMVGTRVNLDGVIQGCGGVIQGCGGVIQGWGGVMGGGGGVRRWWGG